MTLLWSFLSYKGAQGADEKELRSASLYKPEFDQALAVLVEHGQIQRLNNGRIVLAGERNSHHHIANLTPDQNLALLLVSEWIGKTPSELVREAVLSVILMHHDDMKGFALGLPGYTGSPTERAERAWARRFYIHLNPLIEGREAEYEG